MIFDTCMRRHLPAAFFFLGALSFAHFSDAQTVGKTRDSASVISRQDVVGAMQQALRESKQPFNDTTQQQSLIDTLIDFKTVPARAQQHFKFSETENAYIARQTGESHLRAIAQLVDWRYRDKHKSDSPHVLARARELYAAQSKELVSAPTFDVSHIVVRTDTRTIEEAVARAVTAYERLAKGEPFDVVALDLSDDPSVKNNKGRLPPLTSDQVDSAFARNVLREELVGKLLRPFLARSGVHVVRVHQVSPPKQLSFDAVRESLIAKAIDEIVATERTRDWNSIRVQPADREYNFTPLADLIKPAVSEEAKEKVRLEAARIKAEMLQKKNAEEKQRK